MNMELLKPLLARIANSIFAAAGGYLGLTGTDESRFVGACMVLASIGWEWWNAKGEQKVLAVLAKMHPVAAPTASTADAAKAGV